MNKIQISKSEIVNYYNTCEIDYKLIWNLEKSRSMHFGYWDKSVKSFSQALEKENEILAKRAKIKSADVVLDAGCGVGGSSIFLAKKFGCKITGITLSKKQVDTAIENAKQSGVNSLTEFLKMDFENTSFPNESFDVVWAIESICHANSKKKFVKEAQRVLNRGGRLIIADGFAIKESYDKNKQEIMRKWLSGWRVNSLEMKGSFERILKEFGFQNISFLDITEHVMPSSKRLYRYSFPAMFFGKIAELFHLRTKTQTENIVAAHYQYKALSKELRQYGIFYAEKI